MAATTRERAVITPAELAAALGERVEDWQPRRRTSRAAIESAAVDTDRLEQTARRVTDQARLARMPGDCPLSGTVLALVAKHHGPVVPLKDVCDLYFGLSYQKAAQRAALNLLPVPTFRLTPSQKAPIMMRVGELAELIDRVADSAAEDWQKSQL